ncbi:hypothetical protein [Kamptonema formosum]|uniref:hypothetical protein n=1 Tax=Kamptonema formosum TaxID=331992 RepID=UPI00034A9C4F|nr:hypothetical protein [Oscillatoria sp. PCC 10802]
MAGGAVGVPVEPPPEVYRFVAPRDARLGPFTYSEALAAEGAISRWIAVISSLPVFSTEAALPACILRKILSTLAEVYKS